MLKELLPSDFFPTPIFDNVHGFIYLTNVEWEIVNTSFFQRLRSISQLGPVNLVFPGAKHDRFSHSIGVLFLAGKMVRAINEKIKLRIEKNYQDEIKNTSNPDEIIKLNQKKEQKLIDELIDEKLVRLAALLHDIGHYPFSHTIESVIKEHTNTQNFAGDIELEDDESSNPPDDNDLIESPSHILNTSLHDGDDFAHHERIASIVINADDFKQIFNKYKITQAEIDSVCLIITGKYPGYESALIHSELDADRFDYLLRDSYNTGVSYGNFDVDQIIRHMDIRIAKFDEDQSLGLIVAKKGQKAVEDYLIARYFLYSTAIYQKTNIGFNIIIVKIYNGLIERGLVYTYSDLIKIFDKKEYNKFLEFTDSFVVGKMREFLASSEKKPDDPAPVENYQIPSPILRDMILMVLDRVPLKLVYEKQLLRIKDKESDPWPYTIDTVIKDISEKAGIDKNWVITNEIITKITSINPKESILDKAKYSEMLKESIKIFDQKNETSPTLLSEDSASIIKILADYELVIRGFYTKNAEYKERITPFLNY